MLAKNILEEIIEQGGKLSDDIEVFWLTPFGDSIWLTIHKVAVHQDEKRIVLCLKPEPSSIGNCCSIPKAEKLKGK